MHGIAERGEDGLDEGERPAGPLQHALGAVAILNIGGMHLDREQSAVGVSQGEALPVRHDQRVMNLRPPSGAGRGKPFATAGNRAEAAVMNSLRAADTAIASTISRFGVRRGRPPGAASGIIGSSPPIGCSSGRSDRPGACVGALAFVSHRGLRHLMNHNANPVGIHLLKHALRGAAVFQALTTG
jgi:hypothetical protein